MAKSLRIVLDVLTSVIIISVLHHFPSVITSNLPSQRGSHHDAHKRPSCKHRIDFVGDTPFPDIVLALNFNYPYYDNLPILIRFFKPLFPNYIVCGPEVAKGGNQIVVIHQPGEYGSYGSQCVVEAIRRKPGYFGYFYVSDDMIINWWNFFRLDKTKIWFPEPYRLGEHRMSPATTDSIWWKRSDCLKRCSQVFLEMESDPTMLELNATKIYLENVGGRRVCSGALSDIVYIPGRLAKSYEIIAQKFYDERVFLEVATPMCMLMVDKRENIVDIKGLYLQTLFGWGPWKWTSYRGWHHFTYDTYFLHPYKLSNKKSSKEFEERIVIPSEKILKDKCLDVLDRGKFWESA